MIVQVPSRRDIQDEVEVGNREGLVSGLNKSGGRVVMSLRAVSDGVCRPWGGAVGWFV